MLHIHNILWDFLRPQPAAGGLGFRSARLARHLAAWLRLIERSHGCVSIPEALLFPPAAAMRTGGDEPLLPAEDDAEAALATNLNASAAGDASPLLLHVR